RAGTRCRSRRKKGPSWQRFPARGAPGREARTLQYNPAMKPLSAPQLRNVAVVGHNTVGKTTLVAALLHAAGATTRAGRIEDGTCPTDFDAEEIDRKISINLSVAHAMHRDTRINFLDAPG